jgi:hypothetical protein
LLTRKRDQVIVLQTELSELEKMIVNADSHRADIDKTIEEAEKALERVMRRMIVRFYFFFQIVGSTRTLDVVVDQEVARFEQTMSRVGRN